MGWEFGKGLGRNLQGITQPVNIYNHRGKMGLRAKGEITPIKSNPYPRFTRGIEATSIITPTRPETYLPEISIFFMQHPLTALLDTGSEITCVSADVYEGFVKNTRPPMLPLRALVIQGAFGTRSKSVTQQVLLSISILQRKFEMCCLVVQGLIRPCILGSDWLQKNQATLDMANRKLRLSTPNAELLEIPFQSTPVPRPALTVEPEETELLVITKAPTSTHPQLLQAITDQAKLTQPEKLRLLNTLLPFSDVFSTQPGLTSVYQHEIRLHDLTPFAKKSYPVPFALRNTVEAKLEEMIQQGVIERTSSAYSSPMTVVKKKDGTIRICLDARALNEKMVSDHECPPRIEEILQCFHGRKYLTSIDLVSSYWQIPLTIESKKYTAFMYNGRMYCYKVLPFGLKCAVASFSRCMDIVLGPEVRSFTHNYIDDLLIASTTFEEHLCHLQLVLARLKEANLTVNLEKSHFVQSQVKFLGHILSADGIRTDPEKVQAIQHFPIPQRVKHLRAFLGLCNYYRRFCSHYSDYTSKLGHLLRKGQPWKWGAAEDQTFQDIKQQFLQDVMLAHPDPSCPYVLETDSSNYAIASVLYQELPEGKRGVIGFSSRSLRGPEINYTTTEKELLAIVHALQKFRLYLTSVPFRIRTDHKALTFLKQCRFLNERLTRWVLFLQQFDFEISHIKGKDNIIADTLSRYPSELSAPLVPAQQPILAHFIVEGASALVQDLRNLKSLQTEDKFLSSIYKCLRGDSTEASPEIRRLSDQYRVENGLILHFNTFHNRTTIALPQRLQTQIIWHYHEEMGHFAAAKVYTVLKQYFYWGGMRRQTMATLRTCDICQKSKKPNNTLTGPLQPIIPKDVGELVAVDFFGPLPRSTGGVTYLLVAVDVFSKFVKLFPLKRANAKAATNRILNDLLPVIRVKRILSDQGTQFTSRLWRKALQEADIRVTFTTVRNAPSNPSERYMKELGRFFRTYCHDRHTSWAKFVPTIEKCLNNVPHSSTGRSPIEIVTGRKPTSSLQPIIDQYLNIPEENLTNIRAKVHKFLLENAQRRIKRQKTFVTYGIGDLVLVKTNPTSNASEGIAQKFCLLYEGPYRITNQHVPNVYEVTDLKGILRGHFNTNNLRPYHTDT